MNIKTPFSYMEETEIISVNGNVATVRGYVADRSGRREVVRDFPINALRKSEYREELIAENNRFGNIIDWNGHIIEKSIINGQLLNFYLKNEEGNINLSPEYQRDFVWTLEQKQEYIMALLKSRAEMEHSSVNFQKRMLKRSYVSMLNIQDSFLFLIKFLMILS